MNKFDNLKVKFKKLHEDAYLPVSNNPEDTGYDLFAVEDVIIPAGGSNIVNIGIQVADVSPTIWYLVLPRSGLGFKKGIQPHLGVIDQPYRGSLDVKLYNFSDTDCFIKKGTAAAQLAFFPLMKPETSWSEEVTETSRGEKGFGSSDKH